MNIKLSSTIVSILENFASVFSQRTFENFLFLSIGAILTRGSRTVTNILRTVYSSRKKHFTTYHNFFRRCKCPLLKLSRILCSLIFSCINGTIELVVDETLSRHSGPNVHGRSCHRDAVRSTRKKVQYAFGHKWVVVGVRFHWPWLKRPWVLPCLMTLWLSEEVCQQQGLKHRTHLELTIVMLRLLRNWFPDREFTIVADGGFAAIEFAKFISQAYWVDLVTRLRKDAQLFAEPINQHKRGRPRIKGVRLPSPQQLAKDETLQWQRATVHWYGGIQKEIMYTYQQALLYKPGKGTVKIAWIIVRDPDGKLDDEFFYTTDLSMSPQEMIRHFVERWSIEVTFEESRRLLAVESTRNRKKESVLRSFPLLMGLFSIISLWYFDRYKEQPVISTQQPWYHKTEPTFADALIAIRKEIWDQNLFCMSQENHDIIEIPREFMTFVSDSLVGVG